MSGFKDKTVKFANNKSDFTSCLGIGEGFLGISQHPPTPSICHLEYQRGFNNALYEVSYTACLLHENSQHCIYTVHCGKYSTVGVLDTA